jgi:Fur family ferric uptake transcriptional regulator
LDNQDLRRAGLKVTLPRIKILEILTSAEQHHLSAEDVYRLLQESGEEVSLATIYRVLTQFEEADLVVRHNFEGGHAVFELKPDQHHDHLVCIYCGEVKEFFNEIIEEQQQEIARDAGYRMIDHALTIYGACAPCQKEHPA